jgi:hypothetical protein
MKKTITLLLVIIYSGIYGQHINYDYESKEIKGLISGTLYIVPTGDKQFDDSLKSAVDRYWKLTPTKALKEDELGKYFGDEKNYFIGPANMFNKAVEITLASPKEDNGIRVLYIFQGGKWKNDKKKKKIILDFRWPIGFCPSVIFAYTKEIALYGIDFAVKNLDETVRLISEKHIPPHSKMHISIGDKRLIETLSQNVKQLKTKTLILMAESNIEKPFKAYKYKYKVMPAIEALTLLNSPEGKNYCLFTVK